MSSPPLSVVYINIWHNVDFQANTVLSYGHRARVTQRNSTHRRTPVAQAHSNMPHFTPYLPSEAERRSQTRSQIRRKLEEVSTQPEYASSQIGLVALLATGILCMIEQENVTFSTQLVDLAMDAHAVSYIAVIAFLYRRPSIPSETMQELVELLDMTYTLLADAAATENFVGFFLKKLATRMQRKIRAIRSKKGLLGFLRKIEGNDDVDVLSSLNDALNYHST